MNTPQLMLANIGERPFRHDCDLAGRSHVPTRQISNELCSWTLLSALNLLHQNHIDISIHYVFFQPGDGSVSHLHIDRENSD